jgi:pyruvate formate lyase activating enzyme
MIGHILEIQRMSTEDGPGLRTTLFLKGCSLQCPWCHNPESIEKKTHIEWMENFCLHCGACIAACPTHALSQNSKNEQIIIQRSLCSGCGTCVQQCPTSALRTIGYEADAASVAKELLKDRAYLSHSQDGGITISGGEASLQAGFVHELFQKIHEGGLHTALDTCGFCTPIHMQEAATLADLILFDLKIADPGLHKEIVGGDLDIILANLKLLILMGKSIWIRTPIIPGYTDSTSNIEGIVHIIANLCGTHGEDWLNRWELCAFNNLCAQKYIRLGSPWILAKTPLVRKETMESLVSTAILSGYPKDKISWTGMTRKGE